MKPLSKNFSLVAGQQHGYAKQQRGVVLFFALIALVVMSLAAVALIRSVDTSTLIAGNLAFKQAAATSGDAGVESAIAAMAAMQTAMDTNGSKLFIDPAAALNVTDAANGFYSSSATPALNLSDPNIWVNGSSKFVGIDASGNKIRYIIQRMCRIPDSLPLSPNCILSAPLPDTSQKTTPLPQDQCNSGPDCPTAGQVPQYRITSRTEGPANTVSYVQAFVY
jgi:type IV pilus assembly protein PilX